MTGYHSSCRYWLDWESFYQALKLLHGHCIIFTLSCFSLPPHCWPCICCPSPWISLWLQEHSMIENEVSQQYRYILLFSSLSICPLVHYFTGSTNRNNSKAMPNAGLYGQWLLLVLQEGKGCFSLLISASALVSLQGPVYPFALGNQMLQMLFCPQKRKFTIYVTLPITIGLESILQDHGTMLSSLEHGHSMLF